jgi:hypothetical protein
MFTYITKKKQVCRIFEKTILAKRALREVKLLKHFNGHENVSTTNKERTISLVQTYIFFY